MRTPPQHLRAGLARGCPESPPLGTGMPQNIRASTSDLSPSIKSTGGLGAPGSMSAKAWN